MARNQSSTAKHVIRILQQGGIAADNLTSILFDGNEALADKVTRLVKRGESKAMIDREIRSHITALSAEAKEQIISDSMRSGAYQAASTTSYIGSLAGNPAKAYKITKTAVMQMFKLPLPGQNVTVNDLFTGVMTGMSKSTVNITQTAFQSGATIKQMASQIREAMDDPMVTSSIRRKSEALARTAISKVANETRTATYLANDDIVDRVLYSATLDSRTTDICMVNDGLWWYVGDPALQQPPLHVNCRSTLVPVLEGENMNTVKKDLTRPEVVPKSQEQYEKQGLTTRTGRTRKPSTTDKSPLERLDGKKYKNYEGWLKSQPDYYQKDILGPKAFKEFKSSGSLRKALGKTNISQSTWKPPTTTKIIKPPPISKPAMIKPIPTPKPKAKPADTTKPVWQNDAGASGTLGVSPEIRVFSEKSFFDPKYSKVMAKNNAPKWIPPKVGKGAYQYNDGVHMGHGSFKQPTNTLRGQSVFRHEVGHYMENQNGKLAQTLGMEKLRILDERHLMAMQKDAFDAGYKRILADKDMWKPADFTSGKKLRYSGKNARRVREVERMGLFGKYDRLKLAGEVDVDIDVWLKNQIPKGSIADQILDACSFDVMVATGDKNKFLADLVLAGKHNEYLHIADEWWQYKNGFDMVKAKWGSSGSVADLVGAITKNKIGGGHSNKYYTDFDIRVKKSSGTRMPSTHPDYHDSNITAPVRYGQNTEAFANLFDLIHDAPGGITFGRELAKDFSPNLFKYVEDFIDAQ